jgi:hypothetical protein
VTGFRVGDRSRAGTRRPPIPLDTMVARTHIYTYAAKVWDLSIVQGPFSVAPCPKPLRYDSHAAVRPALDGRSACEASACSAGRAHLEPRQRGRGVVLLEGSHRAVAQVALGHLHPLATTPSAITRPAVERAQGGAVSRRRRAALPPPPSCVESYLEKERSLARAAGPDEQQRVAALGSE